MPESTNGKIQNLLECAEQQSDSPTPEESSVTFASRVFSTEAMTENAFFLLREKLFRIEMWNNCSNISSFELFDKHGIAQHEKDAAVGDFIKITLPGSGKDDWVKITEIYETSEEIVLTLQPSRDPTDQENKKSTSHFFTGDSTNNFCLQRKRAKLNFYIIGLNEKTNTEDTSGVLETVRNYAAANLGCFLGIQKAQWQTFCENFIELEKGEMRNES